MSRHSRLGLVLGFVLGGCAVSAYQAEDRPETPELTGVAAPAAFGCQRGAMRYSDKDKDGHADTVESVVNGETVCRGEDTNGDGKLDRWASLQGSQTVDQVSDTDYDGDFDVQKRDTDGNGTLDYQGAYLPANLSLPPNWVLEQQKKSKSQ